MTEDPFVAALVGKWNLNRDLVESLDEQIDAESLGKTKILNAAVKTAEGVYEQVVVAVNEVLARVKDNPEVYVGVLTALRRSLKEHDTFANEYVSANVVEVPTEQKLSTEVEIKLRADRKIAVDSNNAIRGLLEAQQPEWFAAQGDRLLPKLENKRGAVGSRGETGKRLVGTYQWRVGDTLIQQHQMGAVAKFLGTKVAKLRTAVEGQIAGFDWEKPPATFDFSFAGKGVYAHRIDDDTSPEDETSGDAVTPVTEDDDLFNED